MKLPTISQSTKRSVLHMAEMAACIIVSLVVLKGLGMETEGKTLVGGIILSGIAKYARDSADIPVGDYVNGIPFTSKKKSKT